MTPPPSEIKTFTRTTKDGRQYTCTTDPQYIDMAALSAALDSELIWWAGPLNEADLRKTVDHSWCFSLYHVTDPAQDPGSSSNPMVGFARLITDYTTFAYLTDVYILPEHQGLGLGMWMMECLKKMLDTWPNLRRTMLMARDEFAKRMYERVLGMKRLEGGVMTVLGPGASSAFRTEGLD